MQLSSPITLSQSKSTRVNRSKAQIKQYVEGFKASGLTMTEFCASNQLALSTFSKWLNDSVCSVKEFKPLVVAHTAKPEQLSQKPMTLEFKGQLTLTLSSMTTAAFIVDIIKGLTK